MKYKRGKKVAEDVGTCYRLEGDNFWYQKVLGGPDRPRRFIGNGKYCSPRKISEAVDEEGMPTGKLLLSNRDRGCE